jgi:selenocysteine-specific elongation factor
VRSLAVGVIGHVDHGKSALVEALTGIAPDRLEEEQARGLTIVLGFAYLGTPGGDVLDLLAMPGHERFVRTLVAGATGIEAVLLVVAANEGVKPQTVEHVEIAGLLGIRKGVIAISKGDLVSADAAARVADEAAALTAANGLPALPQIVTSVVGRVGLHRLAQELHGLLDRQPPRDDHGIGYLPIDRVFSRPGFGTVVTGTLRRGSLARGDTLEILPGGGRARVRGLQVHHAAVERVAPGQRAAVNLRGVARETQQPGHALATPGALSPSAWLDARHSLHAGCPRPLANGQAVRLLAGTSDAEVRLRLLDREQLAPSESALVQWRCPAPLALPAGAQHFTRRSGDRRELIGAGRAARKA